MAAALRLLERGCRVTLYEAEDRLGGKAGTMIGAGPEDEHGYHIFPMWYRNIWALVEELGIADHFIDCTEFKQLPAGRYPHAKSFRNITSVRYAWHNLTGGVLPFHEAFLFFYAALDLMSQPYRYRARLDQVTVSGFLRSRFYRTDPVAVQFEELMLKGISVPTYEVSAMTMRNVMRFWVRYPEPMHRILNGNLHEKWIVPIQERLEALGCEIVTRTRLERLEFAGARAAAVHLRDGSTPARREVDQLVLAIPFDRLVPLIDDHVFASVPDLAKIRNLRARAMAAFNVYFKERLPGMPWEHVNLLGSRYGLSFIDVSQVWEGHSGTVLNAIASDFTSLEGLSDEAALAELMADLRRYLPSATPNAIDHVVFRSHVGEPLFMNNVGGWSFRPEAATQVPNLFLAGDYCRSHIDLVCMEGALSTGYRAAEALRSAVGLTSPVEVLQPKVYPPWLMVLGRFALLPLAAAAKLRALLG